MAIRKYWLTDEYFIYAIDDPDEGCTSFWVGRDMFAELRYSFGTDMAQVAGTEEDFVYTLFTNNYFDHEIEELAELV